MIKKKVKFLLGAIRTKRFGVHAGKNVYIGKHCVIGANSVVTKDIPDYCVAVGSPARVIKNMDKTERGKSNE